MGNCWGSSGPKLVTSTSSGNLSKVETFQSNTTTSSSGSSNISQTSHFTFSSSGDPSDVSTGHVLPLPNLRQFTLAELRAATKNFKLDLLLGEGGFGRVFKGWIDDKPSSRNGNGNGTPIAVKKLNSESSQGIQEWQAEVDFLGRLSHPNLVKLHGYCMEDGELLLVYEFMQKGSLENHLFGRGAIVEPLPWDIRIKIVTEAARGLAYLHTSEKLIYRDFKASNILLDGLYNAKISDFGLVKIGPSESKSHVTTRVMGTHGYAAPEYISTGHLYVKSDVFGFGVVLVEMLTGLRAHDQGRPQGQEYLVDWVKPMLTNKRKLKGLMDSKLQGKYPSAASYQVAQLALSCVVQEPKSRPSMQEVVEALEKLESCCPERTSKPKTRPSRPAVSHKPIEKNPHSRSSLHPRQIHQSSPRVR